MLQLQKAELSHEESSLGRAPHTRSKGTQPYSAKPRVVARSPHVQHPHNRSANTFVHRASCSPLFADILRCCVSDGDCNITMRLSVRRPTPHATATGPTQPSWPMRRLKLPPMPGVAGGRGYPAPLFSPPKMPSKIPLDPFSHSLSL